MVQRFTLSAGHCPGSWRKNGVEGHYGQVADEQRANNIDADLIPHQTNPWLTHGVIAMFEQARPTAS